MQPKVINLRARLEPDDNQLDRLAPGRALCSVVMVESTVPPTRVTLSPTGPRSLRMRLEGLALNMEPFRLPVLDGVVRSATLSEQARPSAALLEIEADFPPRELHPRLELAADLPVRTRLILSREPLRRVMAGRRIAIDPAHGGRDRGARGPINLQESQVVLALARLFARELEEAGAHPLLLRDADNGPPAHARMKAAAAWGAEAVVVLHTGHETDPGHRGTRTLFGPDLPASAALARCIHRELLERLGLPDRGVGNLTTTPAPCSPACPVVAVEPVCVANPLEEALLRSKEFRLRIARALRNGIARHVAGERARG